MFKKSDLNHIILTKYGLQNTRQYIFYYIISVLNKGFPLVNFVIRNKTYINIPFLFR